MRKSLCTNDLSSLLNEEMNFFCLFLGFGWYKVGRCGKVVRKKVGEV